MMRWLKFGRALPDSELHKTPLQEGRYAVLDTELTSLHHRSNRLLSIGAIAMDGAAIRVGQQFYRVVNPRVEIPAEGVLIHKLRPTDIECGEPPAQALADLQDFIGDRVIVGHFVHIDLKALRKELGDDQHKLGNRAICTARVQRWIVQNGPLRDDVIQQMETVDLATLAKAYDLDFREAHHALDDAFVTARLWQKMLHKLKAMNVRKVGELLKIAEP